MDPATIVAATQLASLAINTIDQYASGSITTEQAHAQLVSACANVLAAIANFNKASASGVASVGA